MIVRVCVEVSPEKRASLIDVGATEMVGAQYSSQSYGQDSMVDQAVCIAHLFSSDKAFSPLNMLFMFVTLDTFQVERS